MIASQEVDTPKTPSREQSRGVFLFQEFKVYGIVC